MEYQPREQYLNIKEAAAVYEVSRAKLHRMIRHGRLPSTNDPRDDRATLVKIVDLEALLRFPGEETVDTGTYAAGIGTLTPEMRAWADALRLRVSGGRVLAHDSTDVIREEREARGRQLVGNALGTTGQGRRRD